MLDYMLTRDRFVIPRRLLPSLLLLGQSPDKGHAIPPATFADLRRTGLVAGSGRLSDAAVAIVHTMTEAALVSSVDVHAGGATQTATIWATSDAAAVGRQVDDEMCELAPVRTTSLPLVLAQLVDVGRRPAPPFSGAGVLADAAVAMALDRASEANGAALDILVAAGLDRVWADRLLIAHQHMRSRWTISSVWTDNDGGHHVRFVSVLDGGAAGYWRVQPQQADPPASRYSVVDLEQVMRLVRSTIPAAGTLNS